MLLLIDGYNLLHQAGLLSRGTGPGGLERARQTLLNTLAASLSGEEARETTVVFDAREAPRGLPTAAEHRGIAVRYAVGYETADELLIELIRRHPTPRKLLVVSSDRAVREAARRRRARSQASEDWWDALREPRPDRETAEPPDADAPLSPGEVQQWLRAFAGEEPPPADESPDPPAAVVPPPPARARPAEADTDKLRAAGLENPFPPGYAEDLLDDS